MMFRMGAKTREKKYEKRRARTYKGAETLTTQNYQYGF